MRTTRTLLLPLLLLTVACGHDHSDHDGHDHAAHDEGHVHVAPRGGTLVVLAEETAHVEVLLEPATGGLSMYVLGPHAETPVRVAQQELAVLLTIDGAEHRVTLPAIASDLTGETVGDSSEFTAVVEELKGVERFSGRIEALTARGATYSDVPFSYPEEE